MTHNLTPMQVIERLIGKPEQIASAIGLKPKAAYHWRNARKGRAAGDLPSSGVIRALLAYAAARHIPLSADHLIWGASEDELAGLVAQMRAAAAQIVQAAE